EQRLAGVEERKSGAELERKRRDDTLSGLLAERHRAEEELAEAAGKHEEATAALYPLRSAIERVELRRERAEETARALRADAARPVAPPPASTFEKTLAAASGWDRAEVGEVSEAGERLELAQAAGLDAVAGLAGDQLWVSYRAQEKARPAPRAPVRRPGRSRVPPRAACSTWPSARKRAPRSSTLPRRALFASSHRYGR